MKKRPGTTAERMQNFLLSLLFRKYYIFDPLSLEVRDFESAGMILDIGGGGEGVIGRLKGSQVVAIDLHQEELDGILAGPQKMVMDARELTFPDNHFETVTAFFSMMYMKTREDQQKVVREAWRVIKPGGRLLIWDIDLAVRPQTRREAYLVRLKYRVAGFSKSTGYGAHWPAEPRGVPDYIQMAKEAGFQVLATEKIDHCFHLQLIKPG